ncbi:MAG: type II secretion system F family protein [Candidatus Pacearchaeota archaeon]
MIFGNKSSKTETLIEELKDLISQKRNLLNNIKKHYASKNAQDPQSFNAKLDDLEDNLKNINEKVRQRLEEIKEPKNIFQKFLKIPDFLNILKKEKGVEPDKLEKKTLERLKKGEDKENPKADNKEIVQEDFYARISNKVFSNQSKKLAKKEFFSSLDDDLKKANLKYTLQGYISIMLFTSMLSFLAGILVFMFFSFFQIQATAPVIATVSDTASKVTSLIWIPLAFPLAGFLISYKYPALEKSSKETQIDHELPFATVNMAAIAGSMINPMEIFKIIVKSGEFPHVRKELTKLINEVNVHGTDMVSALRITARHTPSQKMKELLNGLATTMSSGGDMAKFFDKRSETLLFEHRIKREKETKTAETFMDLYISIVIAAPMIFMLLLMMMKISGLGITLPTSTITLIVVSSVVVINIFFIIYLHMKEEA